jgi:hypothetical protein
MTPNPGTRFRYRSGEYVEAGDSVFYGGRPAKVDFVVTEATGGPAMGWYLEQFPNGGFMITTDTGGSFFLDHPEHEEDLELVSREPK